MARSRLGADEDVKADQTHWSWSSAAATFAAGYLSECPWPEPTRGDLLVTMASRVDELDHLAIGAGHLSLSKENGCRKPL
jgi:hypothetical protein